MASIWMLMLHAESVDASVFTLQDLGQNSSLVFDSSTGSFTSWKVEGVENLHLRQWFFRVGSPTPFNPELPIDSVNLTAVSANSYNINGIPGDEIANAIYQGSSFRASLASIVLTPGSPGSDQATFIESVRIDNTTASPLSLSLILYANYDLGDTATDATAFFSDPRALTQLEDLISLNDVVHEASVTVTPTRVQVDTSGNLYGLLTDGKGDDLNNVLSLSGAANYEYAIQWDLNIAAGRSFTLGLTNSVTVPEAGSVVLIGLVASIGGCGLLWRDRRRSN
jgi:hypothetical protein